jgi:O-acetyl-ADP-ribose deacetylase (regulator of RNase III)
MNDSRLRFHVGNIALHRADVIVNPSNTVLQLGTGVSGAIRRAAAPELQEEMYRYAPIGWGTVAVTEPFGLPCSYLFHAAVIDRNRTAGPGVIRACLANMFLRAEELGIQSIALPALGTGSGGIDLATSGRISLMMTIDFLREHPDVRKVTFCFLQEASVAEFFGKSKEVGEDTTSGDVFGD